MNIKIWREKQGEKEFMINYAPKCRDEMKIDGNGRQSTEAFEVE